MDIVLDTTDLVYDAGVITRITKDGLQDVIKVINQDNTTWYVETPDRASWSILDVDSLPDDWKPRGYYYINDEWIEVSPTPTGSTENI